MTDADANTVKEMLGDLDKRMIEQNDQNGQYFRISEKEYEAFRDFYINKANIVFCISCKKDMSEEARKYHVHLRICKDCRENLLKAKGEWLFAEKDGKSLNPIMRQAIDEWHARARERKVSLYQASIFPRIKKEDKKVEK